MRSYIEKTYLTALRRSMGCCYGTKRRIFKKLSSSISEFLQENPSATIEDLYKQFGDPQIYSNTYIELYGRDKLCKQMPLASKIAVVVSFTVAVLFVISVFMHKRTEIKIKDSKNLWPGYIVEIVQSD